MDDLSEIRERVSFANSEISALNQLLLNWVRESVVLTCAPDSVDDSMILLQAHQKNAIPFSCRAKTGMIVNELRACLDALASVLAIRNGRTPNGAYFPIAETELDFENNKIWMEKIKKLSLSDQQKILDTKPYAICKDGSSGNELLYGLHQADIRRKHHRLVAHATSQGVVIGGGSIGRLQIDPKPLTGKPRTMAKLSRDSINARVGYQPTFLFSEPKELKGRQVVQTLEQFSALTERIINLFR